MRLTTTVPLPVRTTLAPRVHVVLVLPQRVKAVRTMEPRVPAQPRVLVVCVLRRLVTLPQAMTATVQITRFARR